MEEENSLIEQRRANLAALREKGIEPFANKFTPDGTCAGARENYEEGLEVALAGRMTAFRTMGKSVFLDIRDGFDRMQVYAQKNTLGDEAFEVLKKLDLGDFIGVKGTMFTTRTCLVPGAPPNSNPFPTILLYATFSPCSKRWTGRSGGSLPRLMNLISGKKPWSSSQATTVPPTGRGNT